MSIYALINEDLREYYKKKKTILPHGYVRKIENKNKFKIIRKIGGRKGSFITLSRKSCNYQPNHYE